MESMRNIINVRRNITHVKGDDIIAFQPYTSLLDHEINIDLKIEGVINVFVPRGNSVTINALDGEEGGKINVYYTYCFATKKPTDVIQSLVFRPFIRDMYFFNYLVDKRKSSSYLKSKFFEEIPFDIYSLKYFYHSKPRDPEGKLCLQIFSAKEMESYVRAQSLVQNPVEFTGWSINEDSFSLKRRLNFGIYNEIIDETTSVVVHIYDTLDNILPSSQMNADKRISKPINGYIRYS